MRDGIFMGISRRIPQTADRLSDARKRYGGKERSGKAPGEEEKVVAVLEIKENRRDRYGRRKNT